MKKIELNKKEYTVKELRQIVQNVSLKADDKVAIVGSIDHILAFREQVDKCPIAAGNEVNLAFNPAARSYPGVITESTIDLRGEESTNARKELEALLSVSSVAIDQPSFGVQTMIQTLLVDEICGQVQSRIDLVKAINNYLSVLDAEKKQSDASFLSRIGEKPVSFLSGAMGTSRLEPQKN